MSILKRIKRLKEIDNDLGRVDHLKEIEAEKAALEEYFWEWFPHEIHFIELKEINNKKYKELKAIGEYLNIKY